MKDLQIINKINLLGISVHSLSKEEFINLLIDFGKENTLPKKVFYVNANCINIALKNKEYRHILSSADLICADGMGIVWASRLLGNPLKERVSVNESFDRFCVKAIENRSSLYLLGSYKDIVEGAVSNLRKKYPSLIISGAHSGYFSPEKTPSIIEEINRLKPNFLLVSMGVPKQEIWINNNLDKLDVNVCWATGALFDFLAGRLIEAPLWMKRRGFEWFWRLIQEPRRLWRRYLIGNIAFIFFVLRAYLKNLYRAKIYNIFKRFMDVSIGIILSVAFLPFMAIISILIKLDSLGPSIFKHKRVGENGKEFFIHKFRTMTKDTSPYEYKPKKQDPRITKVGKFLRDTGLDELPQLFNILRGDISLVGPRPEMPFIVAKYNGEEKQRLKVKPGITGLWQLSGKNQIPIIENLDYDLSYIKNRSLGLDLKILFDTIRMFIGNLIVFFLR